MHNSPSRLGSLQLPFLPCVSRLLLLPSEAFGSKTESVFGRRGRTGGSKYRVKAQACSPSCLCSAPFHVEKSFTRGYDVRFCSALKDFFCDCAFVKLAVQSGASLKLFRLSLSHCAFVVCLYWNKKPPPKNAFSWLLVSKEQLTHVTFRATLDFDT